MDTLQEVGVCKSRSKQSAVHSVVQILLGPTIKPIALQSWPKIWT